MCPQGHPPHPPWPSRPSTGGSPVETQYNVLIQTFDLPLRAEPAVLTREAKLLDEGLLCSSPPLEGSDGCVVSGRGHKTIFLCCLGSPVDLN